ncbi:MAG: DnaA/Hda family protein [Bacteroidota bacterium]
MEETHHDIWNKCLQFIQEEISPQSFKTWFKPINPIRIENNLLTIEVPSQFFCEWLEEHYLSLLKKAIYESLGKEGKLAYSIIIENSLSNSHSEIKTSSFSSSKKPNMKEDSVALNHQIPNPFQIPGIKRFEVESNLNSNYTFENFIEGECNRLARAAAYAVAKKPGITAFNPLFIFSNNGLGKTHLLQAIGNAQKTHTELLFLENQLSFRFQ